MAPTHRVMEARLQEDLKLWLYSADAVNITVNLFRTRRKNASQVQSFYLRSQCRKGVS